MLRYEESFEIVCSWLKTKEKTILNYKKREKNLMYFMFFLISCCKNKTRYPIDVLQCIICCENQREKAFSPCNHFLMCSRCANQFHVCPICSCDITDTFTIYY
ncbi:MAG: hypothetical protein CMB64_04005 [Euryarchaeota archaeon]|nr:hypothetical protein [Euryarchaeota archaeon]